MLKQPHGIVLITGPTGNGKTTTLYAALNAIRNPELKIITVEDPIEYTLQGVSQLQVKPDIGLTYPAALRSILRNDPDVIMIGEIRDRETADIAIRAFRSLTRRDADAVRSTGVTGPMEHTSRPWRWTTS